MMPNKYYILTLGLDEIGAMKGMSEKRYKAVVAVRDKVYKEVLEELTTNLLKAIDDRYQKNLNEAL